MQAIALVTFIAALLFTRWNGLQAPANNLAVRLSPFAMLASAISSRSFLLGSSLALILLASSLVVGRAWCGWLCPLGTMLDLFPLSRSLRKPLRVPEKLRTAKVALLFIALVAAVFSNLTLLFLDPITIATRTFVAGIFPALDKLLYWLELQLVNVPWLADGVYQFDSWLRPAIFQSSPAVFIYPGLVIGFFVLLVALNLFAERFWCRYLCPLGALLGLAAKLALYRRTVDESCTSCGVCAAKCPTATISAAHHYQSDPSECTMCFNCQGTCRHSKFAFGALPKPQIIHEYDPGRRTFLGSFGTLAVGAVILRSHLLTLADPRFSLRPPGATENTLLTRCIRCGLCLKVCPTQALQYHPQRSTLDGLMTPVFIPRNGFCDYSCNACGQTCPVQAIPALSLSEKHIAVIGIAVIDHELCLAWGHQTPCIVCEEMCPLDEKAITLKTSTVVDAQGQTIELKLPVVNSAACIGCGTCEFKCPLPGDAAIRVNTVDTALL